MQRPLAGRLQAHGAVASGQADNALCGPQAVEDAVLEQALHEPVAVRPGGLGLLQAPLRIAHLVGDVLRWQVRIDGMTLAGQREARMDSLEGCSG